MTISLLTAPSILLSLSLSLSLCVCASCTQASAFPGHKVRGNQFTSCESCKLRYASIKCRCWWRCRSHGLSFVQICPDRPHRPRFTFACRQKLAGRATPETTSRKPTVAAPRFDRRETDRDHDLIIPSPNYVFIRTIYYICYDRRIYCKCKFLS